MMNLVAEERVELSWPATTNVIARTGPPSARVRKWPWGCCATRNSSHPARRLPATGGAPVTGRSPAVSQNGVAKFHKAGCVLRGWACSSLIGYALIGSPWVWRREKSAGPDRLPGHLLGRAGLCLVKRRSNAKPSNETWIPARPRISIRETTSNARRFTNTRPSCEESIKFKCFPRHRTLDAPSGNNCPRRGFCGFSPH